MKWLYKNWHVHNLIAHPLMQLMAYVGLEDMGNRLHDATFPNDGESYSIDWSMFKLFLFTWGSPIIFLLGLWKLGSLIHSIF